MRFSKAGMQPESEGKRVIFQALYRREREEAFEWAATEALEHFSLCPICKQLVCDRCFLLGEDIDLCTDCAAFLQESGEPVESSHIRVFVDGKLDFESDMWVYQTGSVKLTQEHKDIPMTGTFNRLTFSHKENAFCVHYSDGSGLIWLTRDGAACGEENVIFSPEPKTPPSAAWSCPACRAENEGSFCTGCGLAKPLTCEACGWQPKPGASAPAYCPECGNRLK